MTGFIYVVIIALWAAVLIPMWLRRQDQSSEVRSTTQFTAAMQSLSAGMSNETPVGPKDGRVADLGGERWLWDQHVTYTSEVAAKRRFRAIVLLVGVGMQVAALALAFADLAPRWVPVLLAVAILGFLVVTSRVAINESMHPFAFYEGQRLNGNAPVWSREIPAVDVVHRYTTFDDMGRPWDAVPRPPDPVPTAPAARQGSGLAQRSRRDTDITRRKDAVAVKRDTVARRRDTERRRRDTEVQELLFAQELERRDAAFLGKVDYRAETAPLPVVRDRYGQDRAVNE